MHCFITFVKLALLKSNNRPDSPGSCCSSFIVRLHDMSSPPHLILAASDAVQFWSMLVSENVFVSSTRPPEKINKAVQSSGARHDSKSVTRINFVVLIFPLKRGDRSWPLSLHVTHWMSPFSFVFSEIDCFLVLTKGNKRQVNTEPLWRELNLVLMHNSAEPGDMRLWASADERARDSFQDVYSAVSFKPVLQQLQR